MIQKVLKKLGVVRRNAKGTEIVTDEQVAQFTANLAFPYLVSFPRTGSHWLRMLMELYFEKPSMKLVFYEQFNQATDFTCYHTHDMALDVQRKNVLYLYRHPAPTIFSQLRYYKEDTSDIKRIQHWSTIYGQHLKKWLFEEEFTTQKTVLTYEMMRQDLPKAFEKVCDHFGVEFDKDRLDSVANLVSKKQLKAKTIHDKQVVNLSASYDKERQLFMKNHTEIVLKTVFAQHPPLKDLF